MTSILRDRQTRTLVILIVLLVMILFASFGVAACGAQTTTTPSSSSSGSGPTTLPSTSETVEPPTSSEPPGSTSSYGPWQEPPYLDSQPVDLSSIVNLSRANLGEKEKQVLGRQRFVAVAPNPSSGWPWKFWHVYEAARYQGLPVFVTTDSFLNAYHELFDALLQYLEEKSLFDQAVAMSEALYAAASAQYNEATD
ncbi:MAG: DUF3160 domain-containing protein, partial [Anaerolineae bacterium]